MWEAMKLRQALEGSDVEKALATVNSNTIQGKMDKEHEELSPLLESEDDYRFIRSSLYRLYQRYNVVMNKDEYMLPMDKICHLVLRYKGNELPGFISFTTFTKIYMETLPRWIDITKAHCKDQTIWGTVGYIYVIVSNAN
ncbi:hypothetical protein KI688_006446 [Linnemannia hyalina]|uniref:Uncharacterized protein n=1 Tax=Linnemannia hyalina TaxID=64524 RepID=A0A9P8BZS4_9FUNG|nr:hypothetical protein KI688_006446 [Linnemannia hyalina]